MSFVWPYFVNFSTHSKILIVQCCSNLWTNDWLFWLWLLGNSKTTSFGQFQTVLCGTSRFIQAFHLAVLFFIIRLTFVYFSFISVSCFSKCHWCAHDWLWVSTTALISSAAAVSMTIRLCGALEQSPAGVSFLWHKFL